MRHISLVVFLIYKLHGERPDSLPQNKCVLFFFGGCVGEHFYAELECWGEFSCTDGHWAIAQQFVLDDSLPRF